MDYSQLLLLFEAIEIWLQISLFLPRKGISTSFSSGRGKKRSFVEFELLGGGMVGHCFFAFMLVGNPNTRLCISAFTLPAFKSFGRPFSFRHCPLSSPFLRN
ncbi:hypothetical protein Csa_012506 [Cucumis sativus]|uniref:Uncharacterized protein n=1 Tax=Cucumis sativus TaxID=3659 RepID=A0A0A0L4L8_CUCSA|nr:hypothetical protein Csa_012506 [Cucumis sativus]